MLASSDELKEGLGFKILLLREMTSFTRLPIASALTTFGESFEGICERSMIASFEAAHNISQQRLPNYP